MNSFTKAACVFSGTAAAGLVASCYKELPSIGVIAIALLGGFISYIFLSPKEYNLPYSKENGLGLNPKNPIQVSTSHLVEVKAGQIQCKCGKAWRYIDEHEVEYHNNIQLRVARTRCRQCGTKADFYFEINKNVNS